MGQSRPLFVYFRSFLITISILIEKSVDGVLGIWTRGRRMVGSDKTTELWQPPTIISLSFSYLVCSEFSRCFSDSFIVTFLLSLSYFYDCEFISLFLCLLFYCLFLSLISIIAFYSLSRAFNIVCISLSLPCTSIIVCISVFSLEDVPTHSRFFCFILLICPSRIPPSRTQTFFHHWQTHSKKYSFYINHLSQIKHTLLKYFPYLSK